MAEHERKSADSPTDLLWSWFDMWRQSGEALQKMMTTGMGRPGAGSPGGPADLWQHWYNTFAEQVSSGMHKAAAGAKGLGAEVFERGLPGTELFMEMGRVWLDAVQAAAAGGPQAWNERLGVEGLARLQKGWQERLTEWADAVAGMPLGHGTMPALLKGLMGVADMAQLVGHRLTVPWATAYQELLTAWGSAVRGNPEAFQSFVYRWRQAYEESHGRILKSPAMGLSREYIERVLRSFDAYVAYLVALQEFVGILDKVGADAGRKWVAHITALKTEDGLPSVRDLYRVWLDIFEATYNEVFRTPEYSKMQARVVDTGLRFKNRMDRALEDIFQFLPIPTETEIMELYKAFYELRREVRRQRAEIRELKAKLEG
jgi:class III poly(R)-hydroxyalkanoic acid synthase PhaE subunit